MHSRQKRSTPVSEHYFTNHERAGDDERAIRQVTLAGQSVEVETAPGVFSHQHLDIGTDLLLRTVLEHENLEDRTVALDLGCGWGPIALTLGLATTEHDLTTYAVDINDRALDLTRRNAARLGLETVIAAAPDNVPSQVQFDLIVSNPPIRVGKTALHDLLRTWLPRLRLGGAAYLVVAKQLGADSLHRWLALHLNRTATNGETTGMMTSDGSVMTGTVERVAQGKGFRVLRVQR